MKDEEQEPQHPKKKREDAVKQPLKEAEDPDFFYVVKSDYIKR